MRKKREERDRNERKGEQKRKDRNTEKRERRAVWKNERISVILEEKTLRPVELLKLFKPQLIGNASRGLHPRSHTVTVPL